MGDEGEQNRARRDKEYLIDVTVPNAIRAADFLDGGKDNFVVDREAVRAITASAPVIERIPAETRAFRRRAITYLVTEDSVPSCCCAQPVPPGRGPVHRPAQARRVGRLGREHLPSPESGFDLLL